MSRGYCIKINLIQADELYLYIFNTFSLPYVLLVQQPSQRRQNDMHAYSVACRRQNIKPVYPCICLACVSKNVDSRSLSNWRQRNFYRLKEKKKSWWNLWYFLIPEKVNDKCFIHTKILSPIIPNTIKWVRFWMDSFLVTCPYCGLLRAVACTKKIFSTPQGVRVQYEKTREMRVGIWKDEISHVVLSSNLHYILSLYST